MSSILKKSLSPTNNKIRFINILYTILWNCIRTHKTDKVLRGLHEWKCPFSKHNQNKQYYLLKMMTEKIKWNTAHAWYATETREWRISFLYLCISYYLRVAVHIMITAHTHIIMGYLIFKLIIGYFKIVWNRKWMKRYCLSSQPDNKNGLNPIINKHVNEMPMTQSKIRNHNNGDKVTEIEWKEEKK